MRNMFLSLPGLCVVVSNDAVDEAHLAKSLFLIIGKREHVMDSSNADQANEIHNFFRSNPLHGEAVRRVLAKALEKAEIDERVEYVDLTSGTNSGWDQLDQLLTRNGHECIDRECGVPFDRLDALRVDAAIELSKLPIMSIF